MSWYQRIVGVLLAVIFMAAGVAHLVLGRVDPEGYAVFGDTAIFSWLSQLWDVAVMPNIGWLTILLSVYQIACGVGILVKRTRVVATWGMIAFLVFITILGYGLPATSLGEDVLKNRSVTIIMTLLVIPLALKTKRQQQSRS